MRRKQRGLASVLGAAIALAIVITILIPLWMHIIGLQSIFIDQANRRLQFEFEKLNERLEVHVSITPPDAFGQRNLIVMLRNLGALTVEVPSIYLESRIYGLVKHDLEPEQMLILPGELKYITIESGAGGSGFSLENEDRINVYVVTMRGNRFNAPEVDIGPTNLPYILSVMLAPPSLEYRYDIEVRAVQFGDDPLIGCIALSSYDFSEGCKGVVRIVNVAAEEHSTNTIIGYFMVAPGLYSVSIYRKAWVGGRWSEVGQISPPITLYITDDTSVMFNDTFTAPEKIPLRVSVPQPYQLLLLDDASRNLLIPFTVTLGNMTEALRDITITFEYTVDNLTVVPEITEIRISRLSPGETYHGYFNITITDDSYPGGVIIYSIRVVDATGEITESGYGPSLMERPSLEGMEIRVITASMLLTP